MQKGWRKCYFGKSNTHLILWQNYGKLWYYMFSEIYGTIYCDNYGFIYSEEYVTTVKTMELWFTIVCIVNYRLL